MANNYARFDQKVQDYLKYRPSYPPQIATILIDQLHLSEQATVADVGSGTGLSSQPFLEQNLTVYGVEPNVPMRQAAEQIFAENSHFISIDGTSDDTTLASDSIDLIVCGQSFHWFDLEKAKQEFARILKPTGHIALVWNERDTQSPLQQDYENVFLTHIQEYQFVNHKNTDDSVIEAFFSPKKVTKMTLNNRQIFDYNGFLGRAKSSSYTPTAGELNDTIMAELTQIFDKYQHDGVVEFMYKTNLYFC